MKGRTVRTPKNAEKFLKALQETCNISESCKIAKVSRDAAYRWKRDDAEFSRLWDAALEVGSDVLEDEAKRRGVQGVVKPVFQGGKKVGTIREYSDTLLIFLLKGAKPEKYRERINAELTGKNGSPLSMGQRSDDELRFFVENGFWPENVQGTASA